MAAKIPEQERLLQLARLDARFWDTPGVVLAGMDEVGRGPLAGPVVAACVVMRKTPLVEYVNDSKLLLPARRARVAASIKDCALEYAFGWVGPEVVDEINILQATKRAFCQAFSSMRLPVTDVLVDAVKGLDVSCRQHAYVKGDLCSYSIAAASILAKVERDAYMEQMDERYPQYGFASNKGYGTAAHIQAIKAHGPCPLHRRSFIKKFTGQVDDG